MEPQLILTIVLAIIACVVVGVVYYRIVTQERNNGQKGGAVDAAPGEDTPSATRGANAALLRRLRTAAARRDMTLLPTDPAKTPFAALLIGPHGVTAVYALPYDGTIYGSEDETWVQVKDGVRRTFENPLCAAETARRALREQIEQGGFRPFLIEARVVMSSPKAELAIPRSVNYYTAKSFAAYVEDERNLASDRRVDQEAVKAYLQQHFC